MGRVISYVVGSGADRCGWMRRGCGGIGLKVPVG